jgi:hypothetical protein
MRDVLVDRVDVGVDHDEIHTLGATDCGTVYYQQSHVCRHRSYLPFEIPLHRIDICI